MLESLRASKKQTSINRVLDGQAGRLLYSCWGAMKARKPPGLTWVDFMPWPCQQPPPLMLRGPYLTLRQQQGQQLLVCSRYVVITTPLAAATAAAAVVVALTVTARFRSHVLMLLISW